MTDRITLIDVHKSFGSKHVLRGVDLGVAKGESLVIIGGSGTGKSVTLKCILGLIKPDRGEVLIDREPTNLREWDAFLARFGMLFQGAARIKPAAAGSSILCSTAELYAPACSKA